MHRRCSWIACCALACGSVMAGAGGPTSLELLGQTAIPAETASANVPLGGLSALTLDERSGAYLALSDDRSENGPARFYRLKITLPAQGRGAPVVVVEDATTLLALGGAPFPRRGLDPEGIALGTRADLRLIGGRSQGRAGALRSGVRPPGSLPARAAAAPALSSAGGRRRGGARQPGPRVPALSPGRPLPLLRRGKRIGAGEPGGGTRRRRASPACCAGISSAAEPPRNTSIASKR